MVDILPTGGTSSSPENAMFARIRRLLKLLSRDALTLWYACRHPSSPALVRLGAVLLLVYVISPIDVIPDWIPILGWIDDVTLFAFGITALLKLLPGPVVADARNATEAFLSRRRMGSGRS
jgi:uncharacterized membrane protein YkvA (DUF1232 family)